MWSAFATTSRCAPAMPRSSTSPTSLIAGTSWSPVITSVGTRISSIRAATGGSTGTAGSSAFDASAFSRNIARSSSSAPSGAQNSMSSSAISARSPRASAASQRASCSGVPSICTGCPGRPEPRSASFVTRSGCVTVASRAIRPPLDGPTSAARAIPASSSTPTRSSTCEYGPSHPSDRPSPRWSYAITSKRSASDGSTGDQIRESTTPWCSRTTGSPEPARSYQIPFSARGMSRTVACRAVEFQHVLVVGAGQMGAGIAQVVAASGRRVSLHDAAPGATERGLEAIGRSLAKLAEKGGADPDEVLARVEPADDLVAADLMIEAVVEDAGVKEELFRRADAVLPERGILASNTSSIPITRLAAATGRAEQVIGMHFFNPVPVLKLVEVIRGLQTSDDTAAAIVALAEDLGKTPAQANDFPGFVSNRILMPFINESAYALMEGVAEPEAIDTIAKLGFAHPMGPLALADLIGLDTCVAIMEVLHAGLGDDKYAPCPLLPEHVEAGRLGRKSGEGFYSYTYVDFQLTDDQR